MQVIRDVCVATTSTARRPRPASPYLPCATDGRPPPRFACLTFPENQAPSCPSHTHLPGGPKWVRPDSRKPPSPPQRYPVVRHEPSHPSTPICREQQKSYGRFLSRIWAPAAAELHKHNTRLITPANRVVPDQATGRGCRSRGRPILPSQRIAARY
jgi:hypothetical protein